jgi:hypothetical protein
MSDPPVRGLHLRAELEQTGCLAAFPRVDL